MEENRDARGLAKPNVPYQAETLHPLAAEQGAALALYRIQLRIVRLVWLLVHVRPGPFSVARNFFAGGARPNPMDPSPCSAC